MEIFNVYRFKAWIYIVCKANLGVLRNLWVVNCSYLVVLVVITYDCTLTARTMIRYWNGLATPAWESQTQVEYQLVVGTSVGVPTISPSVNWYDGGDAQRGSPNHRG